MKMDHQGFLLEIGGSLDISQAIALAERMENQFSIMLDGDYEEPPGEDNALWCCNAFLRLSAARKPLRLTPFEPEGDSAAAAAVDVRLPGESPLTSRSTIPFFECECGCGSIDGGVIRLRVPHKPVRDAYINGNGKPAIRLAHNIREDAIKLAQAALEGWLVITYPIPLLRCSFTKEDLQKAFPNEEDDQ